MMILVQNSDSREGLTAGREVLSQLRQLMTAGLDVVRTARIKVRSEDGLNIFGQDLADWVSVGSLLVFHISGIH